MAGLFSRLLMLKPGEGPMVLVFMAIFLLIGWGTAVGMATGDTLFIKRYGIEYLPPTYLALSPLLLTVGIVYAVKAEVHSGEQLFYRLFLSLTGLLFLLWAGMHYTEIEAVYPAYFLVNKIASELFLIHGAFYLAQNLDTQQSKRLVAPILSGAQLGSILGGITVAQFSAHIPTQNFLPLWSASLLLTVALMASWHVKRGASPFRTLSTLKKQNTQDRYFSAFRNLGLMFRSRMIMALSLSLFFLVILFYVMSYAVHQVYNNTFTDEASLSAFYGQLIAVTGALCLFIQLFLTSRLIKKIGVRLVNLIFPTTAVIAFAGLIGSFTFPFALFASFTKDTLMPAFRDPARNILFHSLPVQTQGRTRSIAIVFIMPAALLIAAAFLWIAEPIGNSMIYLSFGLITAILYWLSKRIMNRSYLDTIIASLKGQLFIPEELLSSTRLSTSDKKTLAEFEAGLQHHDETVNRAFAATLLRLSPDSGQELILRKLPTQTAQTQDQMILLLTDHPTPAARNALWGLTHTDDQHLRATILAALAKWQDRRVLKHLPELESSDNPRMIACAVQCICHLELQDHYDIAVQLWSQLLLNHDEGSLLAGLELTQLGLSWLAPNEDLNKLLGETIGNLLDQENTRVLQHALHALCHLPYLRNLELAVKRKKLIQHPSREVRQAAIESTASLNREDREALCSSALNDAVPDLRRAAARVLFSAPDEAWKFISLHQTSLPPRAASAVLEFVKATDWNRFAFTDLIEGWLDNAVEIARLKEDLAQREHQGSARKLLLAVLNERLWDSVDLALEALSLIEDSDRLAVIRIGLKSQNQQETALAREALQSLSQQAFCKKFKLLFDVQYQQHKNSALQPQLTRIHSRGDEWLRTCIENFRMEITA